MALVGKAGLECNVAEWQLPACDQFGRVFDAASNHVLMDRHADEIA